MTETEQEDSLLFKKIENYIMKGEIIGIDPRVFRILDNPDSAEAEIVGIEKMIDVRLALRLRNMANSVYYGMHRHGTVNKFNDVITSIGMQPAKLFVIALSLFSRLDAKHKMIEVESFAVSFFAKILAEEMNFTKSAVENAEIGGLFLNLGRVAIARYEIGENVTIDPSFIEQNHREFAVKIIENLTLPAYLTDVVLANWFTLQRNALSIAGIVYLAKSLVEKIIRETGIIEIKSPMPDVENNLETTMGLKISEYFNLIGLGKYLRVIRS
jgi:HD-GYP domain-containing protein (c-di-GMP phosphodiesterase class II)